VGDRRSNADDIDELEAMQVNFGWAGAREYLLRNGFTHMAIQYSKAVTDFMGEAPPEGRVRRRLCYGRIERASDGYEIVRDAARWLAAPDALTGDAPPVPPHDHVIAYGLSGSGYLLRDYLFRGKNAGGEIDGFFVHAAGSKCLALIDDKVGSPRVYHWSTCRGPTPTNGAKVLAVDAQSDLEFNAGPLAREGAVDDPDYVRWEVAGAPHVPVFAMDLTRLGAPQQNPMDWSPIWRSAFHYLHRWVKHGTAPPTAPPITGRWEDEDTWKCDLDADGNALGGIRLPPIEAPRGIYTGFDYSWLDPAVSKGHRFAFVFAYGGRFERFSDETLAERYPTEADYRKSFEAAARRAFDAGYILEEDLRRYTAAPPRDQFFDSAGVRIRYIDVGPRDGEPVVLIHGGLATAEWQWGETGLIDALTDDYRVVALDLRGHGKSDKPHDVEAYGNAMVDDVIRLLDHLDVERAHVVGYSLGGRIVFKLVADHPERVISSMPCGTDAEPLGEATLQRFEALASMLVQSRDARPIVARFNVDGAMTEEAIDREAARLNAMNDFDAVAAVLRSIAELTPDRARLKANAVPTRCVIGAEDLNLPGVRRTAEHMASFDVQLLDGESHVTAYRDPAFIAAIRAFLGEHAVGGVDRFFDSAGVRIRYIDVGPRGAEPIVLIHGGFNSVEGNWLDTGVIDALDDDYRVIALDLRGHGKSEKRHDPAQYGAEFAADVIRLMNHLGIEKAHIAGYSMGGHITFKLVADHPERIRSAMPCGDGGRPASGAFAAALRDTIATLETSGSIRPVLDYFVTPGSMSQEEIAAIDASLRDANDPGAMAAMLRNWHGMDADPTKLAASRVPCLAIIGERDPLRADLESTARRMPNLRVEIMRGHDHMTAFQDPGFAAAIGAFVGVHSPVKRQTGKDAR
jgi:pimeloyl-ACP methyl ester carboxylesterase